jgi:hypothetical protein
MVEKLDRMDVVICLESSAPLTNMLPSKPRQCTHAAVTHMAGNLSSTTRDEQNQWAITPSGPLYLLVCTLHN